MEDIQQLRDIAAQLRELRRTSPTDMSGVSAWNAAARRFSESLSVPLPVQVMHYLHDADLRAKDPEYRVTQDEMLNGIIADLERGHVPEPSEATLSFHPRWLGVAALVVVVVTYWLVIR